MALYSVVPIFSASATATNGSDIIQVTGSVNCGFVGSGSLVFLDSRPVADAISGTNADGSGNSMIKLRRPWAYPTTTGRMTVANTYEGMVDVTYQLKTLVDEASANAQKIFEFKGNWDLAASGLPAAPTVGSQMYRLLTAGTAGGRAWKAGEPIYYDQFTAQWRSFWDGLGTAAHKNAMTSPTDTATADALMVRGAFGFGGVAGANPKADMSDYSPVSSIIGAGSSIPNLPSGWIDFIGLEIKYNDSFQVQIGTDLSGSKLAFRGKAGDWFLAYNNRNILGVVSQASGVPTGAIIQRGSNANGEFTLFADGTAEYWGTKSITGVSINPAKNGQNSTAMPCPDPEVIGLSSRYFAVSNFRGYNSSDQLVYTIPFSGGSTPNAYLNLGTRPALVWPQLDVIGSEVITRYTYDFLAIGRWY